MICRKTKKIDCIKVISLFCLSPPTHTPMRIYNYYMPLRFFQELDLNLLFLWSYSIHPLENVFRICTIPVIFLGLSFLALCSLPCLVGGVRLIINSRIDLVYLYESFLKKIVSQLASFPFLLPLIMSFAWLEAALCHFLKGISV